MITGASRGIGAATARLAARRGFAVCVNYHSNRAAADAVVAAIHADGGQAVAVAADVSREEDVRRLFESSDELLGPRLPLRTPSCGSYRTKHPTLRGRSST